MLGRAEDVLIVNVFHEWNSYKKIMKKHNCEDWFIEVCSKIKYLFWKVRAIADCLYALDENNYYGKESKTNSCDIMNIAEE